MGLLPVFLIVVLLLAVPLGVAARRLASTPPERHDPHALPGLPGARVSLLRGLVVAALLFTPSLLLVPSPGGWAGAVVAVGTIGAGVALAGFIERAAARRDAPDDGALVAGVVTALSVPAALWQATYAVSALRDGPAAGLAAVRELTRDGGIPGALVVLLLAAFAWGLPCALGSHARIREAPVPPPRDGGEPPLATTDHDRRAAAMIFSALCVPVPGLVLLGIASALARAIDARLGRAGDRSM